MGPRLSGGGKTTDSSNGSDYASTTTTATAPTSSQAARRASGGGGVTHWTYALKLSASGVPQPAPGYLVPAGCQVRIRANSGTTAGNAGVVFFAEYREKLTNGQGTPMAPFDDVQVQVANLANLWFLGQANDGVVLSVQSVPGQ